MESSHPLPSGTVSGKQEACAAECVGNWWKVSLSNYLRRVLAPVDILHPTEQICISSIQSFLIFLY